MSEQPERVSVRLIVLAALAWVASLPLIYFFLGAFGFIRDARRNTEDERIRIEVRSGELPPEAGKGIMAEEEIESLKSKGKSPDSSPHVYVGQPYSDARLNAQTGGYKLHDASKLAMVGPMGGLVDGFYINLPNERGLIVYCDPQASVVNKLEMVENWPGPKAARVYRAVEAVRLPSAPRIIAMPPATKDPNPFDD